MAQELARRILPPIQRLICLPSAIVQTSNGATKTKEAANIYHYTFCANGLALAAIQGLHHEMQTLRAENDAMQSELSALKEQVAALVATTMPSR